jgi:hypothetical protein
VRDQEAVTLAIINGLEETAADMTSLGMVILEREDTKIERSWHVQPALQKKKRKKGVSR